MDRGVLVEQGTPRTLLERHDADSLEDVFTLSTGRSIEETGRFSDVRTARRVARRLG
jgi:hypothetical protein